LAIPRKLTATEKVLEPGLKDRWAHLKFKSRFPTAASPRRCTQIISETPKASYRASSDLATIDERMNQTYDKERKDRSVTDSIMRNRLPELNDSA